MFGASGLSMQTPNSRVNIQSNFFKLNNSVSIQQQSTILAQTMQRDQQKHTKQVHQTMPRHQTEPFLSPQINHKRSINAAIPQLHSTMQQLFSLKNLKSISNSI